MRLTNPILLVTALATLLIVPSCQKESGSGKEDDPPKKYTITASIGDMSKVDFVDEAGGIKLTWSVGDKLAMYDQNGDYKAMAILKSGEQTKNGTFEIDGNYNPQQIYSVRYPYIETSKTTLTDYAAAKAALMQLPQTQQGASIKHLDGHCFMDGTNSGNNITLTHTVSILSLKITKPNEVTDSEIPTAITFTNGGTSYKLNMSNVGWGANVCMVIDPVQQGKRTVEFELSVSTSDQYYYSDIETSVAYEAGKAYTTDFKDMTFEKGWKLATFSSTNYPAADVWTVIDEVYSSTSLTNLKDALNAADTKGRKITLKMSNALGVGYQAFSSCKNLVAINLPKASDIIMQAFESCSNLTYINMPEVTMIDENVFKSCSSLTSVSLPKAREIGANVFMECTNLHTIDLPMAKTIGVYAFAFCTNLASVNLPEATKIDVETFSECTNIESISLPKVTKISEYAFANCGKLATIDMPAVTVIDKFVFEDCSKLTSVSLPNLTKIGESAFWKCGSLPTISLPSATIIGVNVFAECGNLATINLPKATEIGAWAFADCSGLATLSLPAATKIGDKAFIRCAGLVDIKLTAPGNMIVDINTFSDFFSYNCTVTLNPDKRSGGGATPSSYNDVWSDVSWANIKFE